MAESTARFIAIDAAVGELQASVVATGGMFNELSARMDALAATVAAQGATNNQQFATIMAVLNGGQAQAPVPPVPGAGQQGAGAHMGVA